MFSIRSIREQAERLRMRTKRVSYLQSLPGGGSGAAVSKQKQDPTPWSCEGCCWSFFLVLSFLVLSHDPFSSFASLPIIRLQIVHGVICLSFGFVFFAETHKILI